MKLFTVDALASKPFSGNQAAICLVESELDASWMLALAQEINYSETAYLDKLDGSADFGLRWFTPACEVDLCGHATLASAHVLWNECEIQSDEIRFHTRSGVLTARKNGESIELNFPATPASPIPINEDLLSGLGLSNPQVVFCSKNQFDALVVVNDETVVRALEPDFAALGKIPFRGITVSAKSQSAEFDFISRFFAPGSGVDEDPVTGSAHCCLAPYWGNELSKDTMTGFQASNRGGTVGVKLSDDRVILSGQAITILRGELADVI